VKSLNRETLGTDRDAPRHLHRWLVRALQVDGSSFDSANEAERALTEWPDRASEDQPRPREVTAAPVPPVTPIIARPLDVKRDDVKPAIPPPVVPEPTLSQTPAFGSRRVSARASGRVSGRRTRAPPGRRPSGTQTEACAATCR
jgi:hypothetical protein